MKKINKLILPLLLSTLVFGCDSNDDKTEQTTDTTAPVITLNGDANINLALNDTYQELGAIVTDNVDMGLIATVTGSVDTSISGSYTITYTATDSTGNSSTKTRTVVVEAGAIDDQAPVITLVGAATINLTLGDNYTDEGVNVSDNLDNNLSATTTGTVDTNTVGTYTLTYTATDAAGNVTTVTRTINVAEATTPPTTEAYIFHSSNDDSYFMAYWGDTWGTNTVYTDQPTDTTYAKALEVSKSSDWGTVVAWGNELENTLDISSFSHAKFKVKTDTFTEVQVFVQSATQAESSVTYAFTEGVDLGNGWLEMAVMLPSFTDMTWFALNFKGDAGTTVLLADIYFTTLETSPVTGPTVAAPTPPAYADNEVIVLYSDSLSQDSYISVWNANWWNAPIYWAGDISGNNFAKYQITAGGIAGGVTGLEFGYENGALDASSKTTWNFDLYIESGISKVELQLVSTDGGAKYTIENPTAGTWLTYELLFADLVDNDATGPGVLNSSLLESIGIQLWGEAGKAVYVDNIYFSGESIFHDLTTTVTDDNNLPIANATVSVGNISQTTNTSGVATLNLPEGEHKVVVEASGYGVAQSNQVIAGGDASLAMSIIALNSGPVIAAPTPTDSNENAFVLYSNVLTVDKPISYWSDNWWNAPTFSEITLAGETMAKLQIIPDGVEGGVTGIQYGIQDGAIDVATYTGLRFNMYATSGISQAVFQIVSTTGPGISTMLPVTTEQWITVELPFTDLVDSTGNFNPAILTQLGVQLWGSTSDAVYIDNIYFYK